MKSAIFGLFLYLFLSPSFSQAQVWVNSYIKSDGTFVQGHYRSDPDGNVFNNWSVYPNINPYTGVQGTKNGWTEYYRRSSVSSWEYAGFESGYLKSSYDWYSSRWRSTYYPKVIEPMKKNGVEKNHLSTPSFLQSAKPTLRHVPLRHDTVFLQVLEVRFKAT